jgi:hypothetical protein
MLCGNPKFERPCVWATKDLMSQYLQSQYLEVSHLISDSLVISSCTLALAFFMSILSPYIQVLA